MPAGGVESRSPRRVDWRGWIAVAWVVFWGSAYVLTVIQARAPQLLRWAACF